MTFKPIPKIQGYYASESGDIFGPSWTKLKANSSSGYNRVSIRIDGKKRWVKAARLVASTYLGLDLEDLSITVDHIDCDKLNDSVINLRLLSIHDNILHKHGRLGIDNQSHKLCSVCQKLMPRCEFGINSTSKDGLKSQCKLCIKVIRKAINDRRSK